MGERHFSLTDGLIKQVKQQINKNLDAFLFLKGQMIQEK